MVLLHRVIAVLVSFVLSSDAHAQGPQKNELGLLLGGTQTPAVGIAGGGSIRVGSGITFQMNYARRLAGKNSLAWYLEFPAVAIPLQDLSSSFGPTPLNYDSFFIAPSLRLKFRPQSRFAPWFSAGGGYALFDESALRREGSHNISRGTSTGTLQFGGGVDVRTPVKVLFPIGLRAEVRDFVTGKPAYNVNTGGGLQHNINVSGGLVLGF
jgi:hypothetical protein